MSSSTSSMPGFSFFSTCRYDQDCFSRISSCLDDTSRKRRSIVVAETASCAPHRLPHRRCQASPFSPLWACRCDQDSPGSPHALTMFAESLMRPPHPSHRVSNTLCLLWLCGSGWHGNWRNVFAHVCVEHTERCSLHQAKKNSSNCASCRVDALECTRRGMATESVR